MKIPPQRNNISSPVTFLKIALPIFSRKKIRKSKANLQWLPCITVPTSADTITLLQTDAAVPLSCVPPCPVLLHVSDLPILWSFYGIPSSNTTTHILTC